MVLTTVLVALAVVLGYLLAARLGIVPGPDTGPGPVPPRSTANASGTALDLELSGAGSVAAESAVYLWAEQVQRAHPRLINRYQPLGSGAGRSEFLAGNTHYAISERPVTADEIAAAGAAAAHCAPINLPLIATLVDFVVNLPGVLEVNLDAATVAGIYQGRITNWNDPALAAINPQQTLPDLAITAIHRSDSAIVNEVVGRWLATTPDWPHAPGAQWPESTGVAANGNSGVVELLAPGAIGYLLHGTDAGHTSASLGAQANAEILVASPRQAGRAANDLVIEIDPGLVGVYPLVSLSYLVVCSGEQDPAVTQAIQAIFGWALTDQAQAGADPVGITPLPRPLAEEAADHLAELG